MNKRGVNLILSTVVFLVITAIVFGALAFFVSKVGATATQTEEIYAKQIALLLDESKPGTKIEIDISELALIGKQRSFLPIVKINCEENEVFVQLTRTSKYTNNYFTKLKKCEYNLDLDKKKFIINT